MPGTGNDQIHSLFNFIVLMEEASWEIEFWAEHSSVLFILPYARVLSFSKSKVHHSHYWLRWVAEVWFF